MKSAHPIGMPAASTPQGTLTAESPRMFPSCMYFIVCEMRDTSNVGGSSAMGGATSGTVGVTTKSTILNSTRMWAAMRALMRAAAMYSVAVTSPRDANTTCTNHACRPNGVLQVGRAYSRRLFDAVSPCCSGGAQQHCRGGAVHVGAPWGLSVRNRGRACRSWPSMPEERRTFAPWRRRKSWRESLPRMTECATRQRCRSGMPTGTTCAPVAVMVHGWRVHEWRRHGSRRSHGSPPPCLGHGSPPWVTALTCATPCA